MTFLVCASILSQSRQSSHSLAHHFCFELAMSRKSALLKRAQSGIERELFGDCSDSASPEPVFHVFLWKVPWSRFRFTLLGVLKFNRIFQNSGDFSWSQFRCIWSHWKSSDLHLKTNWVQGKPRNQINNQKLSSGETPKLSGKLSFWYFRVISTKKKEYQD
jgi:hypothetical protein